MVFSSVTFLTVFLPITCILYFIPNLLKKSLNYNVIGYKNFILLAVSLIFYAWGEPRNIILMLLSIIFNYTVALHFEEYDEGTKQRRVLFIFSLVFNLGLLGFFKYGSFIAKDILGIFGFHKVFSLPVLPIGISFYTFQILSYVIDVYRKHSEPQHDIVNFALYISMFPQLIAGPIVQYSRIEYELRYRDESFEGIKDGSYRFIKGLFKKTVLANSCGAVFEGIISEGVSELSVVSAWLAIIFYAFQIYFDFGGYSDMAIGLGRIFGFNFPENFNHPYVAISVTDFWRRWHITLSAWFRDYVYIPLGGNRCSLAENIFNLFIVWALTGLWHGASWNFVLWGLYYFALLVTEKYLLGKIIRKLPAFITRIVTFIFVLFGWVLFAFTDPADIAGFFGSMLGFNSITGANDLYLITSEASLLIICGVLSTGEITSFSKKKGVFSELIKFIIALALLAVSVIYLIGDSYNPFLYFRF